jgi:acyl-CoA synthetase (AMP-forming)/AMP-acid ligase II
VATATRPTYIADLTAFHRARLAAYRYPRFVEFRDNLPKNAAGKIPKKDHA